MIDCNLGDFTQKINSLPLPFCPPKIMPLIRTRLFGWQPPSPPDISSFSFPSPPCDPLHPGLSHRRVQRDPSWVPRPRNAFIIFRCQYSRENARKKCGDDADIVQTAKTISKRAAEAWKKLPPSEVEHYRELAAQERDEHARKNPHYRFRPVKRPHSKCNSSGSRQSKGEFLVRGGGCRQSRDEDTSDACQMERLPTPAPLVTDQSIRAGRRRSSSAPLLGLVSQSTPCLPGEIRRARSAAGARDDLSYNLDNLFPQPGWSNQKWPESPVTYPTPPESDFSFSQEVTNSID
jgi:hypothetical protein